jgi:multidrug efflux system membrane fusion protein
MRKTTVLQFVVAVIAGILVGVVVWFFTSRREPAGVSDPNEGGPARSAPAAGPNGVTVSHESQTRAGIVVAPLQEISYQPQTRAYGTVIEMQELAAARMAFAQAQAKLVEAQAQLTASHESYLRLKSLYQEDRNVSQKSLQQAEATWHSDEAAVKTAQVTFASRQALVEQTWGSALGQWLKEDSTSFAQLMQQKDLLLQITAPVQAAVESPPSPRPSRRPREAR